MNDEEAEIWRLRAELSRVSQQRDALSSKLTQTQDIMRRLCVEREFSKGEAYQRAQKVWSND